METLVKFFQAGNYSEIISEWEEKQYQYTTDTEAAYILAAAHFRLGNFEETVLVSEQLLGVYSENVSFLAMYAAALRRLSLLERSEEMFKKAIKISPQQEDVLNNYSNLLIDQKRYDAAIEILEKILVKNEDYADARQNLQRALDLKEEMQQIKANKKDITKKEGFGDPLDEAFEVSEVSKCGSKIGSKTAAEINIIEETKKEEFEEADQEMFKLAEGQIAKKQFKGALELLQKLRARRGLNSSLYKSASNALIGQQKFKEAEIMALLAFIQGERTIANSLNLASLSAMRKDQMMAKYWISEAQKIDAQDTNLRESKELLFPNGKAREKDEAFTK